MEMHLQDEFIYQIFVPSFYDADGDGIGDLLGVKEKLPYLASLGVKYLSLSQIFETADRGALYAVTDFSALDPAVGSFADLDELFREAHSLDLRVILTLPIYAISEVHPWFAKADAAKTGYNLFKDYFLWKKGGGASGKRPPKKNVFDPEKAEYRYCEAINEWYLAEGDSPLLNLDNPRARREITDILTFWKEKGADGFVFSGLSLTLKKQENDIRITTEESFEVGKGCYKLLREIKEKGIFGANNAFLLEKATIDPYTAKYLQEASLVDAIGTSVLIRDNDSERKGKFRFPTFLSQYRDIMPEEAASAFLTVFEDETHRRILHDIGPEIGISAAKALCTLLFTAPSVPFLYYGQEIGMTGQLGKSTRMETTPFQWDTKTNAGFTSSRFPWCSVNDNYSRINLAAEIQDEESVLRFYRKMIDFRKSSEVLRKGEFIPCNGKEKEVIAFIRRYEGRELFVICSLSAKEINYTVPREFLGSGATAALSNYSIVSSTIHSTIGLRPFEARIYAPKSDGKEVALRS